jgi:transcriptional repressor NrdR
MVCLYCGGKTEITNSRRQKRSNQVWRRRHCLTCNALFTTNEAIDYRLSLLVDRLGALEPFEPEKLFTGVLLALQDRQHSFTEAREITDSVIAELLKLPSRPIFKTREVSQTASLVIKRFNKQAWHRYTAEHPSLL